MNTRPLWLQLRPWNAVSTVLVIAGGIYICYGVFMLTSETPQRAQQIAALADLTGGHVTPWAVLWIIVGGLAAISARWPIWSKLWGYAVMQLLASAWALASLTSRVFLHKPAASLGGLFVWGLAVLLWWAVARLVDPRELHTEAADRAPG